MRISVLSHAGQGWPLERENDALQDHVTEDVPGKGRAELDMGEMSSVNFQRSIKYQEVAIRFSSN